MNFDTLTLGGIVLTCLVAGVMIAIQLSNEK